MRSAILLTALALAPVLSGASNELYRQFQDPPRTYSVRPFWFWNGKLDAKEVDRQIDEMVKQGVYGAYVHNRTGLQTPYLSDEYFKVVGEALRKSKEVGFHFGFVDEYEWPGGEARDVWKSGLPSRVIGANPDFRMRSLWYSSVDVDGPAKAEIAGIERFQFAVAAKLTAPDVLDASTLTLISSSVSGGKLSWQAPAGKWRVMEFHLVDSQGKDAGLVDLLNPAAIRAFLDLVHEQYYKRYGEHFGTTIDSIFSDHEGDFGALIAWTPALFDEFQKSKGYDLRKVLPLILFDGGKMTPKIRCDYLDVVSEIYSHSYFKQVGDWCEAHHIKISGHLWEETLQSEAAFEGDLQRMMRAWPWPGVDSLYDYGRSPRDFKVTASVAHFRGTRFTVENQGLQGNDSYFDLQKARLGTNTIAAWGASLLIPHAFNYNATRIEYPPDWFYHQPYWKYFRQYADYARRLSFMNDGGRHFADVLYFQPTETAWAYTDLKWAKRVVPQSANPLPAINATYGQVMNRLAAERWDYDVADSYYLGQAKIDGKQLQIGNESYRVLLLPPTTTVRRATMRKIREFYEHGGIVIALQRLPTESMDEGKDDATLAADVRAIFGELSAGPVTAHTNAVGGKSFFVRQEIDDVVRLLDSNIHQDVKLTAGDPTHLFAVHRRKEDADFYWIVNDSAVARDNTLVVSARGMPEKWDAATGKREPLTARDTAEGTEVKLHLDPWDAYYVAFSPDAVRAPAAGAAAKELPPLALGATWAFHPEQKTLTAPYAMYRAESGASGESAGWQGKDYDATSWTRQWLSRERLAVRDWWLVGPFPNVDHHGCTDSLPPETNTDPHASYGDLSWKRLHAANYGIDLNQELGLKVGTNAAAYALTYVYSAKPQTVQFRLAANNNARLWVNGKNLLDWHIHPYYYELREDFALTREAELHTGWNTVLVKVARYARGAFGFYLRITDRDGAYMNDVVVSAEKQLPNGTPAATFAWYRVPVPTASTGVQLPPELKPAAIYYNGAKLAADAGGKVIFPSVASGRGDVLALKVRESDIVRDAPQFTIGEGAMELGSWIERGLPYYSGSASYQKEFGVPAEYIGRKLMLDCGKTGVTAEVWVNGKTAGVRVWEPYTFDISRLVKPGKNTVRIVVTNTMSNERAVENHAQILQKIDLDGLQGPVTIVAGQPLPAVEEARR